MSTPNAAARPATPEQALDALYQVVRRVNLPADAHDAMRAARDTVAEALSRVPTTTEAPDS
jgi:hypothetical protein